ncbi:hypothetical protein FO519_009557 [Halicephalobus sp. NKZ332]|nr:hypothetical protein FO519_009557 [Halicephalobus sp. NKZ332]
MSAQSRPITKEFTILLLGMTGVGKSTYINSIANYLSYETLEDAINGSQPVCIIPTSFSHNVISSDGKFKTVHIQIAAQNKDEKNESHKVGESATQHPRSYSLVQNNIKINIIDVPGVCDTRGVGTDQSNKKLIMNKIEQFPEIHAVWIIMKATENRMTTQFLFTLNEIFTVVPKQAVENISFVVTHSRASEFTPGLTTEPLGMFIKDLNDKQNLSMEMNQITFCIDSESFRFQVGYYVDSEFRESVKGKLGVYEESWTESRNSTLALLKKTVRATAQPTSVFNALTKILATIEQNKSADFRKKLEENLVNGNQIQNDIDVERIQYPQTVCTGKNCISYTIGPNGERVPKFKVCHDECYLKDVVYGQHPQEALIACQIFDTQTICSNCGCSYTVHTHMFFSLQNVVRSKPTVRMTKVEAKAWIDNYIKKLEEMRAAVFNASTVAYRYLHQNAILIYNDSFEEHVEVEIRVQEGNGNPNKEVIENLRRAIEEHKQIVETLQKISRDQLSRERVTDEEFARVLNEVFEMPPLGQTIKKIYESERQTAMEYNSDFEPLPVKYIPDI